MRSDLHGIGWSSGTALRASLPLLLFLAGHIAHAADTDADAADRFRDRWSVSFELGAFAPRLRGLDHGLYNSPMLGDATVILSEGGIGGNGQNTNVTTTIPYRFSNPLPSKSVSPMGMVEIAWNANDRHAFFFGIGQTELASSHHVAGNLPVEQYYVSNVVDSDRTSKLSYTEYTLGWRYTFFNAPHFRLYSRLSTHEVFNLAYREDWTFLFTKSPIPDLIGIRRDMVTEANSASLFMGQVGLGAEWFVTDSISLGLEGSYLLAQANVSLQNVKQYNDFTTGDSLSRPGMPTRLMPDGTLGYLNPETTNVQIRDQANRDHYYTPLRLNFSGWRAGIRFNVYF